MLIDLNERESNSGYGGLQGSDIIFMRRFLKLSFPSLSDDEWFCSGLFGPPARVGDWAARDGHSLELERDPDTLSLSPGGPSRVARSSIFHSDFKSKR